MEFTFLGTGAGMPAKERNVSSLAVSFPEYNGELWLFDCGEGTQRQILYTSVRLPKLSVIFITHLHGDHIYGLPGVLGSRSFQGDGQPLCLIGPKGLSEWVQMSLAVSKTHLHYPLHITEISKPGIVYKNEHFTVEAHPLDHGITCFGYRLIEKDIPGELLVEKIRALGIPQGPIYQRFKQESVVQLPDGRTLAAAPFLGPAKKGRRVAIIGDTRPCQSVPVLAEGVDVMIHEATFWQADKQLAYDYHHSTAIQAATQAKQAGAALLILNHLSARYQKPEQKMLLNEAQSVFDHTQLAADLWKYILKRPSRD
ncbi:MAG: ribonuclease Z [Sporolactobacillus sp.]